MTFDEVLPELRRLCAGHEKNINRLFVVRDVRGQVRVCVEPADGAGREMGDLEQQLRTRLEGFFVPPLLSSEDKRREQQRLARGLIGKHKELRFESWKKDDQGKDVWFKLERRLSKDEWLDGGPPGPAVAPVPPVVAFYSFKGGVGRTTALLSCSWQLAEQGKQVAIVDLDLEAPGLSALCCRAEGSRGVLDYLLDHMVSGDADLTDLGVPADALDTDENRISERITVYPTGELSRRYLEKLARLDFLAGENKASPVATALHSLLQRIRETQPQPDYILLDSRAGLHDLAGLSLHGLAHLDVLVGRASKQSYRGMDLTVQTLMRGKKTLPSCLVVHGMAPVKDPEREIASFRESTYASFQEHVYPKLLEKDPSVLPPGPTEPEALHFPVVLNTNESVAHFDEVAEIRHHLFAPDYQGLLKKMEERLDRLIPDETDS